MFTVVIEMEPDGGHALHGDLPHADPAGRQVHEDMGFEAGWGAAVDQLVELMGG